MQERRGSRLLGAVLLALAAGAFVWLFQPADHVKADLRADAKGFVMSFEYSARAILN